MEVEIATFPEKVVLVHKEFTILHQVKPETLCGDDTQARCIRQWAKQGVILIASALRWHQGCYAQAYRHLIQADAEIAAILRRRKTVVEPLFDLMGNLLGATGKQKLFMQYIASILTHLVLTVLPFQLDMVADAIWRIFFYTLSYIKGAFA